METKNLKKFLIFSQKRAFLIFRGNGNKNPEKISYIFSKKKALYLGEMETSKKVSILQETETPQKLFIF